MSIELEWCPCIDDQTRIDFANTVVADICSRYSKHTTLTLVSLGSGALKQEELIAQLLLDKGYTSITLILIDILYTQYHATSLKELEAETAHFESTPTFNKLGDLYLELELVDDLVAIKRIEDQINQIEKEIEIEQYIALCEQQVSLLHPERLEILEASLKTHCAQAAIKIATYQSVEEYLEHASKLSAPILLYVDPDTRPEHREAQEKSLHSLASVLLSNSQPLYQLYHESITKEINKNQIAIASKVTT